MTFTKRCWQIFCLCMLYIYIYWLSQWNINTSSFIIISFVLLLHKYCPAISDIKYQQACHLPFHWVLPLVTDSLWSVVGKHCSSVLASFDGNIFHITDPLWGESNDHRWIPFTRGPLMWTFDVTFDFSLCKQLGCRWIKMPSWLFDFAVIVLFYRSAIMWW